MKEKQFTAEIMHTLSQAGIWAYKLSDSPTSWTMSKTRFTPEKPCDILSCVRGKFVAIETKQIKSFKAFGLYDMRPSQIESLDAIVEVGGRGFVFLNIRLPNDFRTGQKRDNRLVVFDWVYLRERFAKGSIKAKEVRELRFTRKSPDKKNGATTVKGVFDLSVFEEMLDQPTEDDF